MNLSEIAKIVSGEIKGEGSIKVEKISSIDQSRKGDLVFVLDKKFLTKAENSLATVLIAPKGTKTRKPAVLVDNPRLAMAKLLAHFVPWPAPAPGVHSLAVVEKSVKLGENVSIGPFVYIGENSKVGDNTIIHSHVAIYANVIIGKNVIVHSGAVLGVDGFGFVPAQPETVKIPQVGRVVIEDGAEIYANTCIARGTLGDTRIGRGVKIDNLTHVAHNVEIGEDSLLAGQVGMAGSSILGKRNIVAGQAGFNGHIEIGDNTVTLARAGVTKSFPAGSVLSGFPAQDHKKEMREQAKLRKILEAK